MEDGHQPMKDPLEVELATIRIVYERLKALPPESRMRVVRYVSEVLGEVE